MAGAKVTRCSSDPPARRIDHEFTSWGLKDLQIDGF